MTMRKIYPGFKQIFHDLPNQGTDELQGGGTLKKSAVPGGMKPTKNELHRKP